MFNLLPAEQKNKVRKLYLRRFAIVSIFAAIVLVGIFCVLMLPSFMLSAQKLKSAEDRKMIIESTIAQADKEGLQAELAEIKSDIDALQKNNISAVGIVEKIIINKGLGISLNGFTLTTEASGEKKLFVEGVAQSRDKLRAFLENMEALEFKKVDLPISNFAKDKDIPFDVTIIIANE